MILVTGGTGLAGSHLLYLLVKNGEKIRALYRDTHTLEAVKKVFASYTGGAASLFNAIEWYKADLNDLSSLTGAFTGITHVYHCAALVSFDESDAGLLRKVNIEGTVNIVNLCLAHRVQKLGYISSVAALEDQYSPELITEEAYWNASTRKSSYAITKYGAEMEVWRGAQEGLPVVIVNPGLILGWSFRSSSSEKLFTAVKNKLTYYPTGVTGFVGVKDVAKAIMQLMKSPLINKRYILVAENRSYKEVLGCIAESLGVSPPKKAIKPWMLPFLWRLDWLRSQLTGKSRWLTKYTAQAVSQIHRYSNKRIKQDLNFEFTPLSESIKHTGSRITL